LSHTATSIVDRGSGAPLVLIPGIQGHWEYMRATLDALSAFFRVLTFPLCGERGSGRTVEPARGLENYTAQIVEVLATKGLTSATICGVSFGGRVALRFAATRPAATDALVLVSTPGPGYHLSRRHAIYARAPWVFGPLFLAETPFRLRPELRVALPQARERRAFGRDALRALFIAPLSLSRMAARAQLLTAGDPTDDCSRIVAPTLVVTGEPGLDHVVPVDGTSEYARLIHGARAATIERTGHVGALTRADVFAALVRDFVRLTHEPRDAVA
jgi:pimeloyl-ACP methyl ester carboxylesterase